MPSPSKAIAVLCSGGLDSAILLAELAERHPQVHPLYVQSGLYWETVELEHLRRFLEALRRPAIQPLVVLEMPARDLYGEHWSITGENVPDADSPDEAVYLLGRNLLLLSKALVWCHLHQVPALALALLKANPFPDATDAFFDRIQSLANQAMQGHITIERPYAQLGKAEVLRRGKGLPLEWTFSCLRPVAGRHCGACNKCAERRRAFADAGMPDPTEYVR